MKKKFKKKLRKTNYAFEIIFLGFLLIYLGGSVIFPDRMNDVYNKMGINEEKVDYGVDNIPEDNGMHYLVINDNVPYFTEEELKVTSSYEKYSDLDYLGRAGVAISNIGEDLMPTEERGNIGSIKPTGWHTIKYDIVDGNYLYNRCHLIGYQLTGENKNVSNLITCTREMNTGPMLNYENKVAHYIKETHNHVLYRVTPVYYKDNLLASGVYIEGYSIEDNGKEIKFNIYVYNKQKGINIDYSNGNSSLK